MPLTTNTALKMMKTKIYRNTVAMLLILFVVLVVFYETSTQSITGLIAGFESETVNETNATATDNLTNITAIEGNFTNVTEGNLTNISVSNETGNESLINATNETGGPTAGILLPPQPKNTTQNASDGAGNNAVIFLKISNTTIIALPDALQGKVIPAPPSAPLNYTPANFVNGGFEGKRSKLGIFPDGWFYKRYDDAEDSDALNWTYYPLVAEGHSGSTALFINVTSLQEDNARIASRTLDIEPNTVYNLSFFVKNMEFSKNDFGTIWVVEFNSTFEESGFIGDLMKFNTTNVWPDISMSNAIAVSRSAEDQNGWKETSVLFRTSPEGDYIKFVIHYSASDESSDNYYIIDDINLEKEN